MKKKTDQADSVVPRHIALMMDGNGRWARQRGLPRTEGHRAADKNMMGIVRLCIEMGIRHLTIYVFSTENWNRPPQEVEGMIQLVGEVIERHVTQLHQWNVRLLHLGSMDGIDGNIQKTIVQALNLTMANTGMTLGVALNYGGRSDLIHAIRTLVSKGVSPGAIDEQLIAAHLSTWMLPDPDLIIRTSGEERLSNFLLWEGAHCTFWTTPVLWPDFTPAHLRQAIVETTEKRCHFPHNPFAPRELLIGEGTEREEREHEIP